MELAVGASESAMSSLLGKLGSLLAQEYTLISGVRSEIQYMNDELASMHAFLRKLGRAAGSGAAHDEQTKDWIEQVRDVAYDIEDCIDDFAHRLGHQPRGEGLLVSLRRAWYTMTTLWSRWDIAAQIIDLKNRAQDVGERRSRYGVQDPKHDANGGRPSGTTTQRPYRTEHQPPACPAARGHDEAGRAGGGNRQAWAVAHRAAGPGRTKGRPRHRRIRRAWQDHNGAGAAPPVRREVRMPGVCAGVAEAELAVAAEYHSQAGHATKGTRAQNSRGKQWVGERYHWDPRMERKAAQAKARHTTSAKEVSK